MNTNSLAQSTIPFIKVSIRLTASFSVNVAIGLTADILGRFLFQLFNEIFNFQ